MTGDGRMVIDGDLTFGGNTVITMSTSDTLRVNGNLTLEGNGDITLTSGVLFVTGNLTINGNADFGAGGNVVVGQNFTITGNNADVTVGGGFNVGGTTDIGTETLTVQDGAVFKSTTYTSSGSNITVEAGGTIAVDNGIPAGANVDGGNADTDCTNNCCGNQCNDSGDALSGDGAGVLPIVLKSFTAKSNSERVLLMWVSSIEINNDYYTLERSYDGTNFEWVTAVPGAGNSEEELSYGFVDAPTASGLIYYRLTQTDFDGEFEVFPTIAIPHYIGQEFEPTIYPTLLNSSSGEITMTGTWGEIKHERYLIVSVDGRYMHHFKDGIDQFNRLRLPVLSAGIYILKANINGIQFDQRLVVTD